MGQILEGLHTVLQTRDLCISSKNRGALALTSKDRTTFFRLRGFKAILGFKILGCISSGVPSEMSEGHSCPTRA